MRFKSNRGKYAFWRIPYCFTGPLGRLDGGIFDAGKRQWLEGATSCPPCGSAGVEQWLVGRETRCPLNEDYDERSGSRPEAVGEGISDNLDIA